MQTQPRDDVRYLKELLVHLFEGVDALFEFNVVWW